MKKVLVGIGICVFVAACAEERMQPKVPATTTTTSGTPAPADTTAPTDDKAAPPINMHLPPTNDTPPPMNDTTASANGSSTDPLHALANTTQSGGDSARGNTANTTSGSAVAQGDSESDRKMTAQIRKLVDQNHGLSFGAKNVTIQTSDGRVTLRGAVKSERERSIVEALASQIAGASQVNDLISIAK